MKMKTNNSKEQNSEKLTPLQILTRREIKELGKNLISPFEADALTDVGYDLSVGERVILLTSAEEKTLFLGESVILPPQERFAVETREKILLQENMFGFLFSRISLAWKGLTNLGTRVDPAFQDKLFLIFSNDSHRELELTYGDKICNIMFFRYGNPPDGVKPRGRPSGLVIPPFLAPIEEPIDYNEVRKKYGYGIFALMKYLRPRLENQTTRIESLEKLKERITYIIVGIATSVISGIIIWVLTH